MFKTARIKLTVWYLLIIMLVSLMFSLTIYKVLSNEIERFERAQRFRIEKQWQENQFFDEANRPPPLFNPELIKESKQRIIIDLAFINLIIFIVAGGSGYFLSGKTLKPIKEMVDEQNRFISDASHELRTPLTSLKTAMEVYLRNNNSTLDEAKEIISENIGEVNRLQVLSDQLLQLTQYQKPNGQVKREKILISTIIKEAKQKVKSITKAKQIIIKENITDCEIQADKYSLIDLLVILLDNAIKYSPKKSQIIISVRKEDSYLYLKVIDQGIGIAKDELSHIFDRFYRADNARQKNGVGGYGLGLSIAKKIVELHHGLIEAESKVNKGTTFSVKFQV